MLESSISSAIDVEVASDRTQSIRASVSDVEHTLVLSVLLVVVVVFVFLRTLCGTAIPSIAVPLSLLGTFALMYLAGYSLDNLSLMALTISTGFVVDDAIVVTENIARYIELGESPMNAALNGASQIGSPSSRSPCRCSPSSSPSSSWAGSSVDCSASSR